MEYAQQKQQKIKDKEAEKKKKDSRQPRCATWA